MPTPPVARGTSRGGFAALKRGAFAFAAPLLFTPSVSLRAAPAEPPIQARRAQVASLLDRMAAVGDPQAVARLRTLLEDRDTEPPLRASAATALSLRVGLEAVPLLLPFLADGHEQVRIAVARALGRLGGPKAQQALEDRLPSEEDPLVREALQQGLSFLLP